MYKKIKIYNTDIISNIPSENKCLVLSLVKMILYILFYVLLFIVTLPHNLTKYINIYKHSLDLK